jgi:ring-1,2-phenylacetyl-CoA epoxidase subunit PaaC
MTPLVEYLLSLADDRLILGHRLSEWCGHAPILEEDIALSNIALDCIGQASFLYNAAAEAEGNIRTPDQLVYFREALEYRNLLLVEQPNGDFARTIVRQFFYDAYGVLLYTQLMKSPYAPLAAVAHKAVKELRYHFRHSSQWMLRLGDGTDESKRRVQAAVTDLWRYTEEMFRSEDIPAALLSDGTAVDTGSLRNEWRRTVLQTLSDAGIDAPVSSFGMLSGGRRGQHSEHLGHLLAEMQIVARSFPGITW